MAAVGIPLEKNRWRVPPDTTVQIINPKDKKVKVSDYKAVLA
jgi:hypothetical protein